MNEININIEGYNVNGICVGCLNFNRKMFYLEEAKECFKILGNIDVPDGLTMQVCWECSAAVRAVGRFQAQILKSYDVLMDYSSKHTFLNSPNDLTKHATQRLSIVRLFTLVKDNDEESPLDVETETEDMKPVIDEIKIENHELDDHILIEIPKDPDSDSSQHIPEQLPFSPFKDEVQDMSSDEDVQLSQLKKKKEKKDRSKRERKDRGKKKKEKDRPKDLKDQQPKTYRKLKNLPEEIVELYTMDEQEMWMVRQQDVENKEFAKLKYSCDKCIIGFNSEKLMTDHKLGKHQPKSESSHQCDVCQSYILTADNVSVHRALHLVAFRCKLCEYRTGLKRLMMKHVNLHDEKTDNFTCNLCEKVFSTKSKLSYHKSICKQEKPQCDCCGKVFANKVTLKYHLKVIPSAERSESKPKENIRIPCKGCDKVFYSKKSYRAHVVIHDGLEYPCPVCGKLFQWKRNLARHLRNHAEREAGAKHECRQCGKRFSSRDCLSNHMRFSKRHVSEEAFVHECHYCGKKFATKWCMIDHVDWEHLKKIKYQCSVCLKAFKTAKIMVAHMNNIHEGKKNREPDGEHLCEICGKSYKTVKRLKGHVWAMHTHRSTVKSYKCKLCPATFTWQTSIYKHMKCMHDNTKRGAKQQRLSQPKAEPYGGLELNNRIQYFQSNLVNNVVQNIVQQNVPTVGIVQELV